MQSFHAVHCFMFNTFYSNYRNCYLLCLCALVLTKRCSKCWIWYSYSGNNLLDLVSSNLSMGEIKQINIKSRTIFFYNDMINLKNFESNLLKIDKKQYKGINKYYIEYIIPTKKIDECESIYCVNPLYLQVNHANRYIEEKNRNKYLVFDSTD